jgi:hypothetical protein
MYVVVNPNITDQEIFDKMISLKTIEQWNDQREIYKTVRDGAWIGKHIDASGLIGKTTIVVVKEPVVKQP